MSDLSKVEVIKAQSRGLRGNIRQELAEDTPTFTKETAQLLKFHGVYQQEDRDQRKARRETGGDKAWQFMVRIKNPGGGRLSPHQWQVLDEIADRFGNGTLRITTRQGIQFHGVVKPRLKPAIQELNSILIHTFGACGDGVRNTIACPVSELRHGSTCQGQTWAARIARRMSFRTTAYHEIWLNGERIDGESVEDEPVYGSTYLPRKFKIAVADPHDNCVDLLTNDIGILPELNGDGPIGFHVLVGGGLGSTHGKEETFPRLADPLAFVAPDELEDVVEAIVITQRDLGNRADRRQARLKYVVERLGTEGFRREVEQRYGRQLQPSNPPAIHPYDFHFGWHRQRTPGLLYLGLFIENGRVEDRPGFPLRSTLRRVIREFQPAIFLTPNQDLILADLPERVVPLVDDVLARAGIRPAGSSPLRSASMACPALPTCGLAITEAERRLPGLIDQLEAMGFGKEAVVIRMSGCPNSCSRPPVAEVGLVGKSVDGYSIYLGGAANGTRLARLYLESVSSGELAGRLKVLFEHYRRHRLPDERFGDFCHRIGVDELRRTLVQGE
jgi:sulfite reductase beta subunit-like hemoprotein